MPFYDSCGSYELSHTINKYFDNNLLKKFPFVLCTHYATDWTIDIRRYVWV